MAFHRRRSQSILDGEVPDRTQWAPRLGLWYRAHQHCGTLPPALAGLSLDEVEDRLGMAHAARAVWGDRVTIWGAVPSIVLEADNPFEDFKAYMIDLHRKTAGRGGFIMGVSDNIMPGAKYERLVWIRDFLEERASHGNRGVSRSF